MQETLLPPSFDPFEALLTMAGLKVAPIVLRCGDRNAEQQVGRVGRHLPCTYTAMLLLYAMLAVVYSMFRRRPCLSYTETVHTATYSGGSCTAKLP